MQSKRIKIRFHFILNAIDFSIFNSFVFFFQVQRSRHSKMITDVFQIEETTSKIKKIKKKNHKRWKRFMNQNVKNQIEISYYQISEHVDLIKMKKNFNFQKNVSVDTIAKFYFLRNSISWRVIYVEMNTRFKCIYFRI